MSKRLLYLEDLYDFYSTKYKRSTHFSSEKTGEPIVVQVHGKINFEESNKNKDGLLPVHLQACHTNLNVNNSNIEETVMTSALPSFSNRPILGYIHKVVTDENPDGQWEFYGHNCHEENGELVYDEVPIGIIPESCNAQLVYDKEKDKTYCEVDGYIFEEYSRAAEILQREGECAVSVELSIRELSYDGKLKCLNIEDFWFSGVTILGKNEYGDTIKPGMTGSNIKLADFSADNNSLFAKYENKMIEFQERLEKLESTCSNIQLSKEGGNDKNMDKFNELLEKYGKTAKDIDFEYEDMTDEELESKFEEVFGKLEENSTSEPSNDEGTDDGDKSEENPEVKEDNACGGGGSGTTKKKKKNNSIECSYEVDGETKKFAVSLQEKIYAIQDLVNATYAEADNTYYGVSVYEDYVVMCDYWSGRYYKQSYTSENDNYSLTGDRVEVYAEFVTSDEQKELDAMRSNYASLKEFKETTEKNELHAKREEILNSEKYEAVSETEAFKELVKNMDNYSLEELEKEAKIIFADNFNMKSFAVHAEKAQKNSTVKVFANVNKSKKDSRYGDLFSK
jgi:hypothetical protein